MINQSTLKFLKALKSNNNKVWFDANKEKYLAAKADFENFVAGLLEEISSFDKSVKGMEAKKCIFRIYRDVRFSKDKTPYKNHFGAHINPAGKNINGPGYYLHLAPGGSFLAGGIWMPETEALKKIRQEIDYNTKEFKKILSEKSFLKFFGKLEEEYKSKVTPKGYDKSHPEIELLKFKSYIVSHEMKDDKVLSKNAKDYVALACKALYPLNKFLARAMD